MGMAAERPQRPPLPRQQQAEHNALALDLHLRILLAELRQAAPHPEAVSGRLWPQGQLAWTGTLGLEPRRMQEDAVKRHYELYLQHRQRQLEESLAMQVALGPPPPSFLRAPYHSYR